MEFEIINQKLYLNGERFFLQGMNLFLDKFRLEKDPRQIYTPKMASIELIQNIIPLLKEMNINTVRIWPTILNGQHISSIPDGGLKILGEEGINIVMNLPVNWNLKPSLSILDQFLQKYSAEKYPNIIIYCINNEVYHGLLSPHRYLDAVQRNISKKTNRPTIVTNANLNFPKYYNADIIGADYFMYKYSISRNDEEDVGAVFQMFLEDAAKIYSIFPKIILRSYPLMVKYLKFMAKKSNIDFKQYQKNFLKVLKQTQKHKKPYIIAEYGYTEDPQYLDRIFSHMPVKSMEGHIWYNWVNFDTEISGKINNLPLFEKFKDITQRLAKIKNFQHKVENIR
ncbi:hypothetical protein [Candidatus Lokiarchaeum ossiferum]|uniref:hypothetical protein n=1 Tax=Candidatus Lokiarchaeum ossiferum TaxID=2951803 RepID=UPI00352FA72A